jgi:hypothetical protein
VSEWIDVEAAKSRSGLRLVLTRGVPGPWGEAAKGVFRVKGVAFAKVTQVGAQPNEELFAWLGHRNAPIAVYEDERPRTGWAEILALAERIAPDVSLVPADSEERAVMSGLAHELMGVDGFGWNRRLMLFRASVGEGEIPEPLQRSIGRMLAQYDYSPEAARRAPERIAGILRVLSARLERQRAAGRQYLIGDALSAVDIYWAAMAGIVAPLPDAQCPMGDGMRGMYASPDASITAALDPRLLEHRDLVYAKHMGLPVDL